MRSKVVIALLAVILLAACAMTSPITAPRETATYVKPTATLPAPTSTGAAATAAPTRRPPLGCASGAPTLKTYFDPVSQYCLLYPARFEVGDIQPGYHVTFYGPPLDDHPLDPLRGALSVVDEGLAHGRTLTQVVNDFLQSPGSQAQSALNARESVMIGGEPAELVKDVQGEAALTWQAFVIHTDRIFHFVLYPMNESLAQARPDIEEVWQVVQRSFTFLEAAPTSTPPTASRRMRP